MSTLRRQLSVGLGLSLIGLLTLQWVVVTLTIDHLIEAQMIERMTQEAESLLANVQIDALGQPLLMPHGMGAVYQRPFSGRYYLVLGGQSARVQSRSLWDQTLAVGALPVGVQTLAHVSGPESQPLLLLGHGYRKQQTQVTIYIAESLQTLQQSVRVFHGIYGLLSLLGLLALLAVQRGIVLSRLKPLQQIRARLASVASGEAQQISGQAPAEIMPLVTEFNRVLKNTTQQAKRSRLAAGNLAHALKTRLAQLQLALGTAEHAGAIDLQRLVQHCAEDMHHDIERELKRARLMGEVYNRQTTDLAVEVPRLVATLQKLYGEKQVGFAWQPEADSRVPVEREDMLELLGNLLDNAFKWCRSQVQLHVSIVDGIHIVVEDDGPGVAAESLSSLFQRGLRMDESKPGSGLGLAIVQDIVQHYHGEIRLTRSPSLGGLRVELQLMPA